jgi:hypothetical protein
MKALLYLSGLIGILLLILRVIGIYTGFPYNDILLIAGLLLVFLVFIPLMIADRRRYNRKIRSIIENRNREKEDKKPLKKREKPASGWNLNNSPYRNRKSGLSWGGGNIKAAGAKRGNRRSFLR